LVYEGEGPVQRDDDDEDEDEDEDKRRWTSFNSMEHRLVHSTTIRYNLVPTL
jgi:hypothetical protein